MSGKEPEEKRKFVRADCSVHVTAKRINKTDVERKRSVSRLLSSSQYPYPGDSGEDDARLQATTLSNVVAFLIEINEKVDRILDIVEASQPDPDRLDVKEMLNISGSGVSLLLRQPIELGQLLGISLHLSTFPLGVLKIQGEVTRILPRNEGDGELFEVGIRLLNLTEEERESLIAYTFSQQRKHIRDQKESVTRGSDSVCA